MSDTLFPLPPVSAVPGEDGRVSFLHSGSTLKAREPRLYAAVVRALGLGWSRREIEAVFSVSDETVAGIEREESAEVGTLRSNTGVLMLRTARRAVERLGEKVEADEVKPGDLVMAAGVLASNSQLLTGGATARVEKSVTIPDFESLAAAMGLGGGKDLETGGRPGRVAEVRGTVIEVAVDAESVECQRGRGDDSGIDSGEDGSSGEGGSSGDGGGGGRESGAPLSLTDSLEGSEILENGEGSPQQEGNDV